MVQCILQNVKSRLSFQNLSLFSLKGEMKVSIAGLYSAPPDNNTKSQSWQLKAEPLERSETGEVGLRLFGNRHEAHSMRLLVWVRI